MKHKQTKEFYDFAEFRLDVKKRRLTRGDELIALTPKEFDVLFLLVENAGRVVEKDELLDAIWKDAFVEEATLTRNISWLRKKLAAHTEDDFKIIETLPKRGYRFLPEITGGGGETEVIVVEEQTIQHFQIEEIIEFEPDEIGGNGNAFNETSPTISGANYQALPAAPSRNRRSPLWILPVLLISAAFVFVSYRAYFSQKPANVILAAKIAPFSGLPGHENSPSFSPDGKQMIFSWDGGVDGGNSDVYVKIIGAGDPVRITETASDEINPVFSPDGRSVAFVRVFPTHNEIILSSALGGAERIVDEHASYASVSFAPDGKSIAAAELDLSKNAAGIFIINLANGERTPLTKPVAPVVDHTPRFSPDGKFLAFIRYFSSFHRELFVIPASGGEPLQITSDNVRIYGLAWSGDSRKLYFSSFRVADQLNLWQISIDGGEAQLIATGGKNLQDLAVSPDGKTIAFVEQIEDENVWEIEPPAAPRPLIRSSRADHSPQFSTDGAKIVFASDRSGKYEIWLADADGKNQRQLTDADGSAGSPRFSPDGKFIAYDAQKAGSSDVFLISVNGGAPVRLTGGGRNNVLPAWSADGKAVFFLSNQTGSEQIWQIPASGGEPVQITRHGAFEMFSAPDGETLIYSKGGGKSGLWRVKTNGDGEEPIPELAEVGGWRSWTVAANGIYYTDFAAQPPFQIKFFDLATRRSKVVAAVEKSPLLYYSNLSISPDGRKVLYARQDQSASSIMLADLNQQTYK